MFLCRISNEVRMDGINTEKEINIEIDSAILKKIINFIY